MADRHQTQRRKRIVRVARRALTTAGYDGTTIGGIASRLGISKAAIAYYFPTKDTFLAEFVEPFLDDLEAAIASAGEVREGLSGYLTVLTDHHDVAVWMDTDPVLQNHPDYGARLDAVNQSVARLITAGRRGRRAQLMALAVLGGIWRPVRELSPAELRTHHDEIITTALSPV
ncbi:MAG: TetR/AcrR family transcriptional regulator [Acidimicrobiia bacterium]|nr:TetR/AcrR family transcriptional regulator [Acidimicrobiia bacterium]MBT8217046.1 TetR/AcrR family transcriptional regulator [Acidimicrobiia bacterium]NNF11430.1 TetR/AcrR family transcriptional regulator [Acidimicrobiia bacterium]NNL69137.1 TetR/AcrR family transcriptional regulator [Acidimicrobiia bacterium]